MRQQRFVIERHHGSSEERGGIAVLEHLLADGWKVVAFQVLQETERNYAEEIYILEET